MYRCILHNLLFALSWMVDASSGKSYPLCTHGQLVSMEASIVSKWFEYRMCFKKQGYSEEKSVHFLFRDKAKLCHLYRKINFSTTFSAVISIWNRKEQSSKALQVKVSPRNVVEGEKKKWKQESWTYTFQSSVFNTMGVGERGGCEELIHILLKLSHKF